MVHSPSDVVIVGGGFVGLSAAYWLKEIDPKLRITILERSLVGSGATGKNAGFLTKGSAAFYKSLSTKWGLKQALEIHKFAEESLKLVHEKVLLPHKVNFIKTSSLTLLKEENENYLSGEFGFSWLSAPNLPTPLQKKFIGAYETGPEYKINSLDLLSALKNLLLQQNVTLVENCLIQEIKNEGIQTREGLYPTSKVVLALNGFFSDFHPSFKSLITPRRAQMLAVELLEPLQCPHLYYDPSQRVYFRKTDEKTLIIGGKRLLDEKGEEGSTEKISPVIQEGLEEYLQQVMGLTFNVQRRWSGIMGFTEHELPFISKVSAPLETHIIGGFSGHGMGLGFNSAQDVAQLVMGMKTESFFSQFKKVDIAL